MKAEARIKGRKLKKEECCTKFRKELRMVLGSNEELQNDWEGTAIVLRETAKNLFDVSSGQRKEDKET